MFKNTIDLGKEYIYIYTYAAVRPLNITHRIIAIWTFWHYTLHCFDSTSD